MRSRDRDYCSFLSRSGPGYPHMIHVCQLVYRWHIRNLGLSINSVPVVGIVDQTAMNLGIRVRVWELDVYSV